MKQNLYAWFFEGGVVGVPKRLLGLMEPLGLDFDDLGKIIYLLYAGTDEVKSDDRYAIEAARTLHGKGLVNWYTDRETIDFSPMFDKIAAALGENSQKTELTSSDEFSTNQLNYAALVKKLEREQGKFLSLKEKQEIETAVQKYNWSYDLLYEIYMFYQKNFRRHTYDFAFFCQMAYGAKVEDSGGLARFIESLETTNTKVQEVLRRLGKYNNPTEKQKEMYLKWTNLWKFSHEMILLAADEIGLTGLWFEGQKYFANTLPEDYVPQETKILTEAKKWLDVYFSGEEPKFTPPLHPTSSVFRQEVWKILLQIPYGQTITYGEIARRIAVMKNTSHMSAQAVGGAVGHNEISIIIPCHRVVGTNGSLTGYAGGIDKKISLLKLEHTDMSRLFIPKKGTAL